MSYIEARREYNARAVLHFPLLAGERELIALFPRISASCLLRLQRPHATTSFFLKLTLHIYMLHMLHTDRCVCVIKCIVNENKAQYIIIIAKSTAIFVEQYTTRISIIKAEGNIRIRVR